MPDHQDGLGRAVLDSPLTGGAMWLRWTDQDDIRTLHQDAGLARGWVEKGACGLDGWAALVDGRLVVRVDQLGRPEPVLHSEAQQAKETLRAALDRHPVRTGPDDADGPAGEYELLGTVPARIRRRAAGMTVPEIDRAVAAARDDLRIADRHADAGDEHAAVQAAVVVQEWERVRGAAATSILKVYDPEHDLSLMRALYAEQHRQDIADRAREAAHQDHQETDAAHRTLAGTAAQPLYTALERAGIHPLTDDDHQAVRDLTRTLDPATLRQVAGWLERTRAAAFALRGTEQTPPTRPRVRRSRL
ncbi:hypothetical protein [Kitasatospora sp. CB01950]|uniref:hypothetical protein n=1 Tax=Kitasatospora sp. CB01950 TaxID=1703930 RepID=UPI00093BC9E3|nr:hypothetical protein [Kitasatospora sp. CB01950]OKI95129.1 hypothetical protein AMK19_33240 [Kitasatospora sp. CB01950]